MTGLQRLLMIALFWTAGSTAGVAQHSAVPGEAVVLRQSDMKAMAAAAKVIGGMFKDDSLYDGRAFGRAAATIRDKAGDVLSQRFAGNPVAAGSAAHSNITADRGTFDALAQDLAVYAGALALLAERHPGEMTADMRMRPGEVAGGGPLSKTVDAATAAPSMSAEHAFHMMLQTCTSCHAKFRTKPD